MSEAVRDDKGSHARPSPTATEWSRPDELNTGWYEDPNRSADSRGRDQLGDAHSLPAEPHHLKAGQSSEKFDLVVQVPLHRRRRRERGYDQSALLAKVVARDLRLPFKPNGLKRTRRTEQQAILESSDRISNVRGAFAASRISQGRSVLLVDDVSTTGATMEAAAAALVEAGARSVTGLVFAH